MGEIATGSKYQKALNYVLSLTDYERTPGYLASFDLRRMRILMEKLDNPHLFARSIHIAGTKGKGSTAAMLASVLQVSGHRTGLYTSPHLHTMRERVKVDGRIISEEEFISWVEVARPSVETINREGLYGQLTTFEVLTAIAFLHFKDSKVEFQVLETGLGGRLDATNIVKPEVCIITSISFDHMEILGTTLGSIAMEKAGIIKPGSVVVSSPQVPEAAKGIEQTCQKRGVELVQLGKEIIWQRKSFDLSGQRFLVRGRAGEYELFIPLLGGHQLENAAAAIAALEALSSRGVRIPTEDMVRGLAQVSWHGRLQVLQSSPLFVVDGAHNADSARRLAQSLKEYFPFEKAILIVGTSIDKDISGIVRELAALPPYQVIVTRAHHPRSVHPSRLAEEFHRRGLVVHETNQVSKAIAQALKMAKPRSLVCVTGSLFVVAEAIEYFQDVRSESYPPAGGEIRNN